MAGLPQGFDVDNPICGTCGSEMHDNRNDKPNDKAPDFRCKDKDCLDDKGYRTAYFVAPFKRGGAKKGPQGNRGNQGNGNQANRQAPPADEGSAAPASAPRPTVNHYTPGEKQAIRAARVSEYVALMAHVKKEMVKIALGDPNAMIALDMANVQAATYSLFGLLKDAKALRDPVDIIAAAKKAAGDKARATAPVKPAPRPRPEREPEPEPASARNGRPSLIDTRDPAERARDGFEEFPSALEGEDDELPF